MALELNRGPGPSSLRLRERQASTKREHCKDFGFAQMVKD